MRIGHGYDVHRLVKGRPCILGGVAIEHEAGPDGHSDADVPVHALMDALLGALALGDIGALFPDTDPSYKGADSLKLLRIVTEEVRKRGFTLGNADITIIAQAPKLSKHIPKMRQNIAAVMNVDVSRVSVKATTEEKLGFTGAGLGIAAHAVVLLEEVKQRAASRPEAGGEDNGA
jgi:2-C-methyl-D-erythritol 2,4-cyclodiphosphate synthase